MFLVRILILDKIDLKVQVLNLKKFWTLGF